MGDLSLPLQLYLGTFVRQQLRIRGWNLVGQGDLELYAIYINGAKAEASVVLNILLLLNCT